MVLSARRLSPGELDHELIWLSVSTAGPLFAAVWFAAGLPWPHCIFLTLTGHPCLTCGATRSAIQFFHGHFLVSLRWNPLVFAAICGIVLFNLYSLFVLVTRKPRLRFSEIKLYEKNIVRVLVVAAVLLNWSYLLAHSQRY